MDTMTEYGNRTDIEESKARRSQPPSGVVRTMAYEDGSSRYFEICIQPGACYHKSVDVLDTCLFILEGTGSMEIGEDSYTLRSSTFNPSPARFPQLIRNTGDIPLKFLEIQPSATVLSNYPMPR